MDSQELMKLSSEIQAGFNSERIEKLQSILNDILVEALQKHGISADENLMIDIVLNYNQSQSNDIRLGQGVQQISLVNEEQLTQLRDVILNRCVWTSQGIRCS